MKKDMGPLRIIIGNQAAIMRALAMLLDGNHHDTSRESSAKHLREIAEINEKLIGNSNVE